MTKKPIYKRWWFILLVVLIVIGAAGALTGGGDDGENKDQDAKPQQEQTKDEGKDKEEKKENLIDGFEPVGKFSEENDGYSFYITGKVKNKKGKDLSYAQIIFNLYDKDGAQIGTAIDNINNIKADGVWKFKAVAFENADEIASWEIDSIDAF